VSVLAAPGLNPVSRALGKETPMSDPAYTPIRASHPAGVDAGTLRGATMDQEAPVRDHAHLIRPFDPEFDEVGDVEMTDLIADLITGLGEDVTREGLLKTPDRVERSLRFLTSGYQADVDTVLNGALFAAEGSEMVVVKGIEFYSMCEHHMLPFFGKAHIAYIPGKKILGLSKFARVVDVFARRMQVQERMTIQIADALEKALEPVGLAVVTEASHLCMMMRGVEKQGSSTRTTAMRGVFRDDARTRQEFLEAIRGA
jgi:GTP cyclohydrolase IA